MKGENKIIQDDHHYSKLNFIQKKLFLDLYADIFIIICHHIS